MSEEEEEVLENLASILHIHHIDTSLLFEMRETIQKQQEEIEKKDKIINEMAEEIPMTKQTTPNFENEYSSGRVYMTKEEIKQYFESKV